VKIENIEGQIREAERQALLKDAYRKVENVAINVVD
jgi:hypothetical protein